MRQDTCRRICVFASGGICGSRSAFRCLRGTKYRHTIFHARVGLVQFSKKARRDKLRRTCVIASCGICRSRSALRCIRGVKHRCTIFHACVGPVRIPQKARRDTLRQTCVLHSAGSVGDVVHCGVSGAQIVSTLFFLLGWDRYVFQKKRIETRYAKLVFLYPVGFLGQVVHCRASRS
jgi:hypothetical protein